MDTTVIEKENINLTRRICILNINLPTIYLFNTNAPRGGANIRLQDSTEENNDSYLSQTYITSCPFT